ncbi:hypothetical protein ELQ92_01350 [Labedella populi]|uniref:FtsK domain-containing protein n=1 Tax=Labedella populi TaxID=2498850 RepID=A0A3S3ZW54_9MICO|nr:hypothetical protein ELQ92_01350 [Labedella populi]
MAAIRFEAHTVEPIDRLTTEKIEADFFDAHPCTNPSLIPLARTAFGDVWSLPLHHTIILGMTGSGKGSPLAGIVRQLAPFVVEGRAKLYGSDPKASKLKPYGYSTLFEDLAYDDPEMAAMIETVHDIMKDRTKNKRLDLDNADLGRSLEYTTETPLIVLIIDEFLSLLIQLQEMGKEGKRTLTLLTAILAQGRSLGVLVVAATQEADKELLGRMRGNFANAIALKQPSEYFNDLFLGQGAAAAGFDSTKIAPANKANNSADAPSHRTTPTLIRRYRPRRGGRGRTVRARRDSLAGWSPRIPRGRYRVCAVRERPHRRTRRHRPHRCPGKARTRRRLPLRATPAGGPRAPLLGRPWSGGSR